MERAKGEMEMEEKQKKKGNWLVLVSLLQSSGVGIGTARTPLDWYLLTGTIAKECSI